MKMDLFYTNDIPELIVELANTPAVQRLKEIGMNCGCEYTSFPIFRNLPRYNRYEHSVGVSLIIWSYTHDITQSIAGLLHDISTPVFAHTIDFLKGDYLVQETTEEKTRELIEQSKELNTILLQNNISIDSVCNYHLYPIADNDSPKLSADRLEYTLGNLWRYHIVSLEQTKKFYDDIIVSPEENELIFKSEHIAIEFAKCALECSKVYVSDEDRYSMQILSEIIKSALDKHIITESELYKTENTVIEALMGSELKERWSHYCGLSEILRDSECFTSNNVRTIYAKKRYIDPFILEKGRVSEVSSEFNILLNDFVLSDQSVAICAK